MIIFRVWEQKRLTYGLFGGLFGLSHDRTMPLDFDEEFD